MKKYTIVTAFNETNLELGGTFTEKQFHEVYRDTVDHSTYPDFQSWFDNLQQNGFVVEAL